MYTLLSFTMLGLVTGQIYPTTESTATTGSEWVKEVQTSYNEGKYKNFLDELENYYQAGVKSNSWQPLIDQENDLVKRFTTPDGKRRFDEIIATSKKINAETTQLKNEANQNLRKVVSDYPNAPISLIIRDSLHHELNQSQINNIERLEELLSPLSQRPDTPLVKELKKIRFESDVKWLLLSAAYKKGNGNDSKIPYFGKLTESKMDEYRMVLNLDKFNKMQKLAQQSNERDMANLVSSVLAALPILSAGLYDDKVIQQELKNPITPADVEAAKVIQNYNKKRSELLKKFGLLK